MFIGQRVFTRGADIQEYRLFLLIKEPFENQIPDEQRVSYLFQTTATQSRSLIRSVMSKYQYELQDAINSSLRSTVGEAEPEGDDWTVTVNSENIVESLNRVIGSIDGSLPQIEKKHGTVSNYVLRRSSYTRLCERFGFCFTPKHASWLNQIEIFFSILARRLLKHGRFDSETDLAEQMLAFVEHYNLTAKPFAWTYTGKVLVA